MSAPLSTITHPAIAKKPDALYRQLAALYDGMLRFFARRAALADLREYDDFALRDIGLARGDIEAAVYGRAVPPDRTRMS